MDRLGDTLEDPDQTISVRGSPRHPINLASLKYWRNKCGARPMPARADIDPCEIVELLPHVVLIDVMHDPTKFRYRLVGTHVDYHMTESRTGQWLAAIPHQAPGSILWSTLESVVADWQPVSSAIPYVGPHKDYMVAEDMIMPLSSDGARVNMLFVTIAYVRKTPEPKR